MYTTAFVRTRHSGLLTLCIFVRVLCDGRKRHPCLRNVFIAGQAERHCIKHALPVLVVGAQIPLEIGGQKVIVLADERLREVPPGRIPVTADHLFHHAWGIGAHHEALLVGKAFHRLDKDMQAGGAFGLGIPGFFHHQKLRRICVYEPLHKPLAFGTEAACRTAVRKGMHPKIEQFCALQDGIAHLACAGVKGERPERCRWDCVVCHDGE